MIVSGMFISLHERPTMACRHQSFGSVPRAIAASSIFLYSSSVTRKVMIFVLLASFMGVVFPRVSESIFCVRAEPRPTRKCLLQITYTNATTEHHERRRDSHASGGVVSNLSGA